MHVFNASGKEFVLFIGNEGSVNWYKGKQAMTSNPLSH